MDACQVPDLLSHNGKSLSFVVVALVWVFRLHLQHGEVPRARIKPMPQQQPKPLVTTVDP